MKSLIDYYDDFAQDWADRWYPNEALLPYLKEFMKCLPQHPRVLDLCCGAGYESFRLQKLGASVIGVDLSKTSIKIAREKNPSIKFVVKDMLKSYTDLGDFHGVACIAGIIHLQEDKVRIAFKNIHEVLVDGGYALIVVKDGDEITKSVEVNGEQYAREFYCYTLGKLIEHSNGYLNFIKELPSQDKWRYYIFKKVENK